MTSARLLARADTRARFVNRAYGSHREKSGGCCACSPSEARRQPSGESPPTIISFAEQRFPARLFPGLTNGTSAPQEIRNRLAPLRGFASLREVAICQDPFRARTPRLAKPRGAYIGLVEAGLNRTLPGLNQDIQFVINSPPRVSLRTNGRATADHQRFAVTSQSVSMKKSAFHAFQIGSFLGGVALFVYLLRRTGLATLGHYFEMLGWGFVLIVALSAVRNCARAGSWYLAIEPAQRGISFWRLMNVMLAGEAIKYLTATGPLLGEPAKAAMIRRQIPLLQGFSSVLVENLIYYLTVFIFMFAGLPTLAWIAEVPGNLKLTGYILMALIGVGVAVTWLAISSRWFVLARALEQLARFTVRRRAARRSDKAAEHGVEQDRSRIESVASQVRVIEGNLYSFYELRRRAFYLIFSLNMGAHLINVVEVYLILALLKLPGSLLIGFLVEAVTKVINLVFFFVPTRAGVYESGNALLLQALGMSAAAGVALAIIRKLRAFVWVGYGLVVIALTMMKDNAKAEGTN